MVGQSQLWVSRKGVAFDMQGPPLSPLKNYGHQKDKCRCWVSHNTWAA